LEEKTMKTRLTAFARVAALLGAVLLAAQPIAAGAAQTDPAGQRIESFDATLLESMKGGKALGVQGRYRKMAPAVGAAFDLPTMTRFAVGPAWDKYPPAQQQQVLAAFTRLSIANFAHNFDSWSGEQFVIDGVQVRGPDKLVSTRMVKAGAAPVNLSFRMRQSAGGGWKVIDVYYGAISQLTTQRADFASSAAAGAPTLVAHLNQLSDKLLR
jgi:phospholipid transport system substrate-binding protein